MKFLIVAECTIELDEIEFDHEPTGPELLKMMDDVNERFKEMRLKVQANQIRATCISDPIEEVNHDV